MSPKPTRWMTNFVWLIEWPYHTVHHKHGPSWWSGNGWRKGACEAVRFSRQQDAEAIIEAQIRQSNQHAVALEHGFDEGAAMAQPPVFKQQGREANGQYSHKGDICVCGHPASIHAGAEPHDCFNEDTGLEGATGVPCDCKKFKAAKAAPQPEPAQPPVAQSDEECVKEIMGWALFNEKECARVIARHRAAHAAGLVAVLRECRPYVLGQVDHRNAAEEPTEYQQAYHTLKGIDAALATHGGNQGEPEKAKAPAIAEAS